MVDKSIFFLSPERFPQIPNEIVLGTYKDIQMWEKAANFKLAGLDLQITTHRLLATSRANNALGFIINLENVIEQKDIKEGLVFKKLVAFKVKYKNQTKIEFKIPKGIEDAIAQVKGALSKKEWLKIVPVKKEDQIFQAQNMYSGIRDMQKKEDQKAQEQQKIVQSSFQKGDISSLFQNARELKEISQYLKGNLSKVDKQHEQSDLDKILSDLGYFNVITKEEAGNSYLDQLSNQIYSICNELFPKLGGIITLLDVFYFVNKKRQTCLLNPQEVLDACSKFQALGLNAIVTEYGNVKVVEQTTFDTEKDFQENIGKFITHNVGITAEQLARKLNISPVISRIKLNKALKSGKLVIDDSIEGQVYYKNFILDFQI
ncbi:hypothetical protein ABPG72_012084 [Tetrahymena utriculariae]